MEASRWAQMGRLAAAFGPKKSRPKRDSERQYSAVVACDQLATSSGRFGAAKLPVVARELGLIVLALSPNCFGFGQIWAEICEILQIFG